jgi:hypothetical protein
MFLGVFSTNAFAQTFNCTEVIGFSQVGQQNGGWYVTGGAFEFHVEDDEWQLLWQNGAGVDRWKNPEYAAWNLDRISGCASDSELPDRVVLSVSGPHGEDVSAWQADIEATINTIRELLPSVGPILLQSVVGAPPESSCNLDRRVRAAWQHYPIREAIQNVAASDPGISEGYAPVVATCDDYRDALGHLTAEGAVTIGNALGAYYANLKP